MDFDTYTSASVQLAVDLANVDADDPREVDAFVAGHDEWFTARASRRLTVADRAAIGAIGADVHAVAAAGSDAEARDALNRLLGRCEPAPRVTDHDGVLHVHYSPDDARLVTQLGATVAMAVTTLVCRYGRGRLGVCAADDCDDVYVDASKNRSRRYCDDTCASRTTVSAYRARRRAAGRLTPSTPS